MFSAGDLLNLAKIGGPSLALSLLIVLVALWRGWLELGSSAAREREFLKTYATQMKDERDGYRTQVEARQNVVEQLAAQATEISGLIREFGRLRSPTPDPGPGAR